MKYLVMECHPGYAVLLDEEGRFLKAANFSYEVGQRVEDPILMQQPRRRKRIVHWKASLIALTACLAIVMTGYYYNFLRPYGEVYLTINPSVCMELNRQGNVIALRAMNQDGEMLLEDYERASSDRIEVVGALIGRAIDMGYLSEGGTVRIEVNVPNDQLLQRYHAEFEANVSDYLANYSGITVVVVDYDEDAPGDDVQAVKDPVQTSPDGTEDTTQVTDPPTSPIPDSDNDDDDDDDDHDKR